MFFSLIITLNQIKMNQSNTLPESDAHFISLSKAIKMTTVFRREKENILSDTFKNKDILPFSETFNRKAFDSLLAEDNCTAIRVYMGMDDGLKVHAIIVGVNQNNEDILPVQGVNTEDAGEVVIVEEGQRCPVVCPPPSPLTH